MKNTILYLFVSLFIFSQTISYAQNAANDSLSLFSLMEEISDEALSVTITSNFQKLISNKFKEEYQPATLSFIRSNGDSLQFDGKIKPRGNSRKQICFYPPLKIKVKKAQLQNQGLLPFNNYKLVTQCKSGTTYSNYILKEFLTYKLMEKVYPYSFKVRMLKITYIDIRNNGKIKEDQRLGFIIESDDEIARRLDAKVIDRKKSGFHHLEREFAIRMALFQYMIGNTDWAMPNLHNMKVLKVPEHTKLVPVPYDFDYCGLVNTDYAVVHESYAIKSVRERLYIGPSCEETEGYTLAAEFAAYKEEVIKCVEEFELLDQRQRDRMVDYLTSFFEEVENEKKMKRVLNY